MQEEKIIKSHAKFLRLSPRKARLVVNEVRGMKAVDALAMLKIMPQKAAHEVYKVIHTACANAEHNLGISKTDLIIKEIKADQGPTFKRYKPRARGSADTIRRRMTHLSVILISTTGKKVEKKPEPKPEPKKPEPQKTETQKKVAEKPETTESVKTTEVKKEAPAKKEIKKEAKQESVKEAKQEEPKDKPKPKVEKKVEPKKDHSFMGGIRQFFRRKGQ